MSYPFYKILHYVGIFALFIALGGLTLYAIQGGEKKTNPSRKLIAITHGVALFLILLAGFGMMARLGITSGGFPGWIWFKLGVWVVMGAMVALPYRFPKLARPLWLFLPLVGALAAWAALYKPFT